MDTKIIIGAAIMVAVTTAAVLCYTKSDGWGWFLFIALMLGFTLADISNKG